MISTENINYPAPKQEYKVLVRCFTFNHSKYIEDALYGFAMQQTNFPFVCLVMDDASTDGEQMVIKKWMERECDMSRAETIDISTSHVIIVPHKINTSCCFAFYLLKQNLYGTGDRKMNHVYPWRKKCEYEALCEGDDYWIDSLKLQKQVDFLERNPEYVMSYTDAIIDNCDPLNKIKRRIKGISGNITNYLVVKGNPIVTASVCIRTKMYLLYTKESKNYELKMMMGDLPLWIFASKEGLIHYLNEKSVAYRVLPNSASHFSNSNSTRLFIDNIRDIQLYMNKYYNLKCSENQINISYYKRMLIQMSKYSRKNLFVIIKECLFVSPISLFDIKVLYYILKCLVK